ncbi:MAG: hypothetical protein U5R48_17495 [Gammaproteobacteria bacterium]|nr:hypothetical protein [Gammaproteobacteria bacterium]
MAEPTYHLVFRGEVLEDQQPADVCRRLAALLKMPPEKAKQLFGGRQVVLKRDVPKAVAARYQAAFRKAGARLRVLPAEDGVKMAGSGESRSKAGGSATAESSRDAGPGRKPTLAERLAAEEASREAETTTAPATAAPGHPAAATVPDDAPGADAFSVAPEGGDLVAPEEIQRPPPVEVDVGHLSAAPPQTGSLEDVIRRPEPPPPPDTSMLSLDAPGVDLSEVHEVEPPELDLSALSLAEPGAGPEPAERPPPPPAPDPGFSLAEPGADLGPGEQAPAPPPPSTDHLELERERASFRPPES